MTHLDPTNIKKKAAIGAIWTLIDRIGGQALSFTSFIILARLLKPEDYGLAALAWVFLAVPTILLNEGFATALVQRQKINDYHIHVAFWANLLLAVLFVSVFLLGADLVAKITDTTLLASVLRVSSLALIPVAIASVTGALFLRKIQYRTFALRTLIAQSTGTIIGIFLALLGFGVWSVVALSMTFWWTSVLVLWKGIGWRPKVSFSIDAFQDLSRFSYRIMLGNTLRMAYQQADALIIGIFPSPTDLGFYYLALRLLVTVESVTIMPVVSVTLPVLSRMQNDPERLRATYGRMLWAGACIWVPAVVGLGATAPQLLTLLFGPQWTAAASVTMVVTACAASVCLTRPTRELLLAVNRPEAYAGLSLVQVFLTVAFFVLGVQGGVVGAGWAFVAVSFAIVPFHLYAARRYAGVSPLEVISSVTPIFGAGAIMSAAVYSVAYLNYGYIILALQVVSGLLIYGIALFAFAPGQTKDLVQTFWHHFGPLRRRMVAR